MNEEFDANINGGEFKSVGVDECGLATISGQTISSERVVNSESND